MADTIKKGTFYGVGVGPGDPELMTLRAVRVLESCPVLAAPRTASGEMTALGIARQAARLEGKEILPLDFSMSRDPRVQRKAHQEAARAVRLHLDRGEDVAMAVLGDVSVFSTYCYLMELLEPMGYPCVMVPGVPSFCAVAARLGRSLTAMDRPLHILPAGAGEGLDLPGSKVLMKSGRQYPKVLRELEERGLLEEAAMVSNCGMADEQVYPSLRDRPESGGYFTTIIIP